MPCVPVVLADGFYFSISKAFRNLFLDYEACSITTSPHWWTWLGKKSLLSLCLFPKKKKSNAFGKPGFLMSFKSLGFRRKTPYETLSASYFTPFLIPTGKRECCLISHFSACVSWKLPLNHILVRIWLYGCILLLIKFTGQVLSRDTYLGLPYQLWRKWHLTEWHFLWQAGNFRGFKTISIFSQKNSNAISWVNKQPWGIQWEWSSCLHSTRFQQTPVHGLRISDMYIHKARSSGLGNISTYENERSYFWLNAPIALRSWLICRKQKHSSIYRN